MQDYVRILACPGKSGGIADVLFDQFDFIRDRIQV